VDFVDLGRENEYLALKILVFETWIGFELPVKSISLKEVDVLRAQVIDGQEKIEALKNKLAVQFISVRVNANGQIIAWPVDVHNSSNEVFAKNDNHQKVIVKVPGVYQIHMWIVLTNSANGYTTYLHLNDDGTGEGGILYTCKVLRYIGSPLSRMSHSPVNRPHSIARIEQAHQKRYWQGQLCQETRSWSTLPYFNWHGKACSQPARLLPQLLGSRYHPAVQDTLHPSSDSQSYLLPPSWVAVASHMMHFAHVPVVGGNYDSDGVVCEISDRVVGIYNMHVNASHA